MWLRDGGVQATVQFINLVVHQYHHHLVQLLIVKTATELRSLPVVQVVP